MPGTLLFDHEIFTREKAGGISRYFAEIIPRIRAAQFETRVFGGLYINEFLRATAPSAGVLVPALPRTFWCRKYLSDAWFRVYLYNHPPDILHKTHYCVQYPPRSTKVVITVYDMIGELIRTLVKEIDESRMAGWDQESRNKRYWCQRADAILTISETTKRDLHRIFDIPLERIVVTHLAAAISEIEPRAIPLGFDEPFLLYVGARHGYKNHTALLRAYSRSLPLRSNFRLLFFGGGPFSTSERALLTDLGITTRVTQVTGPDEALSYVYKRAKALIYPSIYEGFGIPLLEAMSLACPLICSNAPALQEVAGSAAQYFDPGNDEMLQSTLERALFDESQLRDGVAAGLERSKLFSWAKCADLTASLYRAL